MIQKGKHILTHYSLQGFLYSYSQIFFTKSIFLSVITFFISFFDSNVGISGVISIISTIATATFLGFDRDKIASGSYSFNSLLVGMGIGISYKLSLPVVLALFLASNLTFFLVIAFEGIFYKYDLPFLSIPFIITLLSFHFASKQFQNLGLNENWLFEANELYKLGGLSLTKLNEFIHVHLANTSLRTYFYSLGAIVFQVNIIAGIGIAFGILIYSRIFFMLSLIGFYTAYYFYKIMGVDVTNLTYSFIGFNFILTAIAAGGFFTVPNLKSIVWTIIILPLVAVFTLAFNQIFSLFHAPIYAIPFNIVVLLFIYILKLRIYKNVGPDFPVFQYFNPERNLYHHRNFQKRFPNIRLTPIYLPFWGKWSISQGHDGDYTHKSMWRYAWDFVIKDESGKEYTNTGDELTDYYCYDKPIVSPANGYVVKIQDHIPDNAIGDVNIVQNWGNTVVLSHDNYIFTQISHLKAGSIQVHEGSYVAKGQIIGHCGNSGRSPYPHLHFQIQVSPEIGAHTIEYPIAHYFDHKNVLEFKSHTSPKINDEVSNIESLAVLENALMLKPGQELIIIGDGFEETIFVDIDSMNNKFIESSKYNSKAYFTSNEVIFNFTSFTGSKKSVIYTLFKALFHVQFGFKAGMEIYDEFSLSSLFSKYILSLHDFIAPFGNILKSKYSLVYTSLDNPTFPSEVILNSKCNSSLASFSICKEAYRIHINSIGITKIEITKNGKKSILECAIK